MSSLEAGKLIFYFSNFLTEGWARHISLFSSRIFCQFFLTHLSKNSFVIHAFEFAIYSTGRVLVPLKYRGFLILLELTVFFASVHVTTHHNSYSIFVFSRRNTFHLWMLKFCLAEACKTCPFHRRWKYFSARNHWLNSVIFPSIFEHNLIQH